MLRIFAPHLGGLAELEHGEAIEHGRWIDLFRPHDSQVQQLRGLGVDIPSLDEMEEIEISNRLYREVETDYMTAVLPGTLPDGQNVAMPVTFILTPERLVTVRHHEPRPFVTFPGHAERSAAGVTSPDCIFLGLMEEIVSQLADLLEGVGNTLRATAEQVFTDADDLRARELRSALVTLGQQSQTMAQVHQGLLSVERVLSFYTTTIDARKDIEKLRMLAKSLNRDVQALEVHGEFLGSRISLTLDATLGLINLEQNNTVKVLSVVAALFLPPTVIASIFGMNFEHMPGLDWVWGYPLALVAMVGSALAIYLLARWKQWL